MLFCIHKYWGHFLQRKITGLVLLMIFSVEGYSQFQLRPKDTLLLKNFSPVFVAALKNPYTLMIPHAGPSYRVFMKKPTKELMHWPNYPLTAGQIIARETEWQRRNNQSIGEQIASDIIKNKVNALIYGRQTAPAAIPRF